MLLKSVVVRHSGANTHSKYHSVRIVSCRSSSKHCTACTCFLGAGIAFVRCGTMLDADTIGWHLVAVHCTDVFTILSNLFQSSAVW